jgi:hypothetical protein
MGRHWHGEWLPHFIFGLSKQALPSLLPLDVRSAEEDQPHQPQTHPIAGQLLEIQPASATKEANQRPKVRRPQEVLEVLAHSIPQIDCRLFVLDVFRFRAGYGAVFADRASSDRS